jgi:hypothetical protein
MWVCAADDAAITTERTGTRSSRFRIEECALGVIMAGEIAMPAPARIGWFS